MFCFVALAGMSAEPVVAEAPIHVLTHPIPDPLVSFDGQRITHSQEWLALRRPELLATFEREVYGITPEGGPRMEAEVWDDALMADGKVRRKQVRLSFHSEYGTATAELLIYAPVHAAGPVPVFLGLNSGGNATIWRDPGVPATNEGSRGRHERRWPVTFVTEAGYAIATLCCDDFFPDKNLDSYVPSVQRLFPPQQRGPGPQQWGAIATWAWGLSRALDYLVTDAQFDSAQVAVIGHSRLGKAALWAGARDPRFALVISNDSGCGGAALSKRIAGETVARINERYPYWFCTNFLAYNGREEDLPVDQHELLALVAPRALAVGSAVDDSWADPVGERQALELAQPVFALFGVPGINEPTPATQPRGLHYHLRPGSHDIILPDWEEYVRFADQVFARTAVEPTPLSLSDHRN